MHAQAKDLELFPAKRNAYGFFGKVDKGDDPWDMGWWRFRVPGRGVVDWPHVVDRLYEAGFDGTLSVEHEDPLWGGTDEKVLEGSASRTAPSAPSSHTTPGPCERHVTTSTRHWRVGCASS